MKENVSGCYFSEHSVCQYASNVQPVVALLISVKCSYIPLLHILQFLSDRTNGRAYATVLRLSVVLYYICMHVVLL